RPGCSGCHFDCRGAADCDDQNPCNGAETCATETTHACVAGTPRAGRAVPVPGGNVQGLCRGGACAVAGCGDKLVQSGEECDDGNQTTGDGCESDCRYTCKADADCSDGNACTGEEKCGLANHPSACSRTPWSATTGGLYRRLLRARQRLPEPAARCRQGRQELRRRLQ
ncbi:MAG: DUF4215 domain-containing protein, partial [Proteobacteria bacterium]|nr:DUF4215 domain-containing protein [Pseudomonadota bacterium]